MWHSYPYSSKVARQSSVGMSSAADMSRRKQRNPKPCFTPKEELEDDRLDQNQDTNENQRKANLNTR